MSDRAAIRQALASAFSPCRLCPRACGAVRPDAAAQGYCQQSGSVVYQHFIHCGEELIISPSFIINMMGCNLDCPACSERSRWGTARHIWSGTGTVYGDNVANFLSGQSHVAAIEWIGGEPGIHLPFVLEASWTIRDRLKPAPPIYLNTNGYYEASLLPFMASGLDGFVFDLKACHPCGLALTGAADYWPVVTRNIVQGTETLANRAPQIVRHLVVPGHVECCTEPILRWLRIHVPEAWINLMTTFQNFGRCEDYPEALPRKEADRAIALAKSLMFPRLMIDGVP